MWEDLGMIVLSVGFFALAWLYVEMCERLEEVDAESRLSRWRYAVGPVDWLPRLRAPATRTVLAGAR